MPLGVFRILAPTRASTGYALYLAINAASVWGGVFPFLPTSLQSPTVTLWFFAAQMTAACVAFALTALGSYRLTGSPRAFWVRSAGLPYVLGWAALAAALLRPDEAVALAATGGALIGLGSAGFALLWQRLFAGRDAEAANRDLLAGTAWASAFYYALCLIPQPARALIVPAAVVPLFILAVLLNAREVPRDQPMFADQPRDNARVYRQVLRDHWRSALCVGTVGLSAGVMRAVAVADPEVGSLVNLLSMAGVLVITILIAWLWSAQTLSLSIVSGYQVVFPFLITSVLALPLLGDGYARWLAAVIYAVYSGALLLTVMQCAQTSRDRGVNPAFVYGYFGAIVFTLHGVGFLGGSLAGAVEAAGVAPRATVALVAAWALGLMHFVGSGGFSRALRRPEDPHDIELVALGPPHPASSSDADAAAEDAGAAPADGRMAGAADAGRRCPHACDEAAPIDRATLQAQRLRGRYRLSARETEVVELIARGHSVARIAETLVVTENTVRTHVKRIYAKLDVHKKQELVDLLESMAEG